MSELVLLLAPFIVNFLAAQTKRVGATEWIKANKNYFRAGLAVVAFLVIIAKSALLGEELDIVSTTTAVETVLVWASSQGVYFLGKK